MYPEWIVLGYPVSAYSTMMAFGVAVALIVLSLRARREGIAIARIWLVALFVLLTGLSGAFAAYMLITYGFWALFTTPVAQLSPGLVFYGGLLGGIPGWVLGARIARVAPSRALRLLLSVLPIAHALGRVGCFFAGCCYGIPTASLFGGTWEGWLFLIPVQLIEAAGLVLLFVLLSRQWKEGAPLARMQTTYVIGYGALRFGLEFLRGDEIRGQWAGLSTSQWISLTLCLGIVLGNFFLKRYCKRQPYES